MGQVPTLKYLLIGSGRLARHLNFYFEHLNLDFETWTRKTDAQAELPSKLERADVILLAISDNNIQSFYEEHASRELEKKSWVHFSGAFHHSKILGFHPLMSFGSELYDVDTYRCFPFVGEENQQDFKSIFPSFPNPSYKIPSEKKALYHAYCVMGGNFTQLLWWRVEEAFQKELGLPPTSLLHFKAQVFSNTLKDSRAALTGPLVRGDIETIDKNLSALKGNDPALYQEFVNVYQRLNL